MDPNNPDTSNGSRRTGSDTGRTSEGDSGLTGTGEIAPINTRFYSPDEVPQKRPEIPDGLLRVAVGGVVAWGVFTAVRAVFRWFKRGSAIGIEAAYPGEPIASALKNNVKIKTITETQPETNPPTKPS